jgi:hypothetical protein
MPVKSTTEQNDNEQQHEWGCQWKTFLDGDYDRMITHHPLTYKPLSKTEAEEEVKNMLAARIPARLISRAVTKWSAVEDN